ncbi:hypothetical protein ACJJTC_013198 [Scirpophaga incertulas]
MLGSQCPSGGPPSPEPIEASPQHVPSVAIDFASISPPLLMNEEDVPPESGTVSSECREHSMPLDDQRVILIALGDALQLGADAAPAGPKGYANAFHLLSTVFRACMAMSVRCVDGRVETLLALLRVACGVAARGPPQEELPRTAAAFLGALATSPHPPPAHSAAMRALHQLAQDRSWWARMTCLEFAQPLFFYSLPLLHAEPERAVQAEEFALKLMRDPRIEVRKEAASLLTGLMHCRALTNEAETLRGLMRCCRSKELVERHCGVLGLCSYVASRPYSLGPKLGDVLSELSRHTTAPDPIPATIRNALADFRRTHQDDWAKHREQLTEEELDLLADLTSPPSYCA